jgi:HAD superfamily hydrolase (TIGR01509 family)
MCKDLKNISVIAIDYGGVLAHHYCEPYQSLLAEQLEVTLDESKKLISEKSEQGKLFRIDEITMIQFWQKVIELAKTQKKVDFESLQLLWARTYILDNRIFELLKIIRSKRNKKLCLFTNTDRERFAYMQKTYNLDNQFDYTVCSFRTKMVKPSNESFFNLTSICGQINSPENILYIDDREQTIKLANESGIVGLVYENYDQLVDFFLSTKILTKSDFINV